MRSQLRKDIHSHADDRLYQWVRDTFDTYDRVDLDQRDAAADTIFSMMCGIGALAAAYKINPEKLTAHFSRQLSIILRAYAENESQS